MGLGFDVAGARRVGQSFAGQPFLLPDATVSEWLERYLAPRWQTLFAGGQQDSSPNSRWVARSRVGLPTPNWTPPPEELRLGALYWPTGASRFGFFLGLVDEDGLDGMLSGQAAGNLGGTSSGAIGPFGQSLLKLGADDSNDAGGELSVTMHMLPPRPVSLPEDQRWFWQFIDAGNAAAIQAGLGSWNQLFAFLFAQLSDLLAVDAFEYQDAPAAYLKPDSVEFYREFGSVPRLLDAAAASIGLRLVLTLDGNAQILSWANTDLRYLENIELNTLEYQFANIAGGPREEKYQRTFVPGQVQVAFQVWRPGLHDVGNTGVHYTHKKTKLASAYGFTTDEFLPVSSAAATISKTFLSSCRADFSTDGVSPDNDSELDALANQVASDYYASLKRQYDYCYAGLIPWVPCAYDDWIVWYAGARCEAMPELGEYLGQTRVISQPYNFGVQELLHESSDVSTHRNEAHQIFPFELTSSLTAGGSCSGQDLVWNGTDWEKVGAVNTYDDTFWTGGLTGSSGQRGWFFWQNGGRIIFVVECD